MLHSVSLPPAQPKFNAGGGITHVVDLRQTNQPIVATDVVLHRLDAAGLAVLRRTDHAARCAGRPLFRCAACDQPVHIRVTSIAEAGVSGGERAHFVHDLRRGSDRECPCGSFSNGDDAKAVDGARFDGQQEGARHTHLKVLICQMLMSDPTVADAACEVVIKGHDAQGRPTHRRPDIVAWLADGRTLALDLQIAAPLMTTIEGRERFYSTQNIGWAWVVDAAQVQRLQRQGFQDLIHPQGARVLGFDEGLVAQAPGAQARFRLLQMRDRADSSGFQITRRSLDLEAVLALAGQPARAQAVTTRLRPLALFHAIRDGDADQAALMFNLHSTSRGCPAWSEACRDHLPALIRLLHRMLTQRGRWGAELTPQEVLAALPDFFQPRHAAAWRSGGKATDRHLWAPLIQCALSASQPLIDALAGSRMPAVPQSALSAAWAAREEAQALMQRWEPMLEQIFPGLMAAMPGPNPKG